MKGLSEIQYDERVKLDAQRFEELDVERCQLCGATGQDKRSLYIHCLYAIHEVVPEFIRLDKVPNERVGYYMRICKSCRRRLLSALEAWARQCRQMQDVEKDSDGEEIETDPARNIPVRINGATVMMYPHEYEEYRKSSGVKA